MARTMVFTCFLGDVTWGWEPKDDQYMLVWLQTLLDGKFKFHITKKNAKLREVTKVTQVADLRKVTFKDDEFLKLLVTGVLGTVPTRVGPSTGEIARTPEEIIDNDTIVTQPVAGG
jgi:hypothetical protein